MSQIKAKQIDIPSLITALNLVVTIRTSIGLNNGLTWTSGTGIGELGGSLIKNTTIQGAGYILQIQNSSSSGTGVFHASSTKTSTTESSSLEVYSTYTKITTSLSTNVNNFYVYFNKIIANTNTLQFLSTNAAGNSSHQLEFISLTNEVVAKIIAYRGATSGDHELRFNVNTYKFLNDSASTTYWWVDSTGFYLPSLVNVALGTDGDGKIIARSMTSDVTNGITVITSKYGLGGDLVQNTIIDLEGFSFSLSYLTSSTFTFDDAILFDSGNNSASDSGQVLLDYSTFTVTSQLTAGNSKIKVGDNFGSLYNVAPFDGTEPSASLLAEQGADKSEVYVHADGVILTSNAQIRLNCTNIYTGLISVGVLGTDADGKLISQSFSLLLTNDDVTNGISLLTGKIALGGTLVQSTSIALSSYNLNLGSNYFFGNGNITFGAASDLSSRLGLVGSLGGKIVTIQDNTNTEFFRIMNTKTVYLGDSNDYFEFFIDTTSISLAKFPRIRAFATSTTDNGGLTIEAYASNTANYAAMRFYSARYDGSAVNTSEYAFTFTSPSKVHLAIRGSGNIFTNITSGNFIIGKALGTDDTRKLQVSGSISFTSELYVNGSAGTSGQVLYSQGAGVAPVWGAIVVDYGDRTNISTTTYTIVALDFGGGNNILGLTNSGARTITLPLASAVTGKIIWLVDEAGTAATNNVTINATGGNTILGASSLVLSENYASVGLYSDGSSKWFIV